MLAITPLRTNNDVNHIKGDIPATMELESNFCVDDFPDFAGGNLLDSIDFDELFMGMHDDDQGDLLPDLEMDPELLAEFSLGEDSNNSFLENINTNDGRHECNKDYNDSKSGSMMMKKSSSEEEIQSNKDPDPDLESDSTTTTVNSSFKDEGEKGKKSSSFNNKTSNNQGKRKAKVDWTPELHRRFVQAVEQLGVDKAVPSRILELMGIDCLTRHNIASHLQKYRSHRKHLLAREAEAANWTQKRQFYGISIGGSKGGPNINPWHSPTMGFPPMSTMHHSFRPLHVWGHPTMDLQSRMPVWPPKQVVPSPPPPPPVWTPPLPVDPSFWHPPHQRRFTSPTVPRPVPGIPSHTIYGPDHGVVAPTHPGLDAHPSKESIDAAIGDILAKPWQPLPIGLKPPSIDSVMVELQRQGVPKIPPSCG